MIFSACLVLLPIICAGEEIRQIGDAIYKRGIDHGSNIALLNNLYYDTDKQPEVASASPTSNAVNVGNPDGTIPVTINTESLALGNPNPLPQVHHTYAPTFPQNVQFINPAPQDNIIYYTGEGSQIATIPYQNAITPAVSVTPNNPQNDVANSYQDNGNTVQTYVPQNVVDLQQQYPVQLIREIKVPQPYPVHITRTIQVPVQVRVPVEVPKPYAVRVPHPVPVPVHIRVPVTVEKPYPVQVTKTVAVPVEKPVYIKVPQPIAVPVPQPYPVAVPQPVQVQVPYVVRLPEVAGGSGLGLIVPNVEGSSAPLVPNFEGVPTPLLPGFGGVLPVPIPTIPAALPDLSPTTGSTLIGTVNPTTVCNSCKDKVGGSTAITSPKPNLPPVKGNGLLPPNPPTNPKPNLTEGLLNSYVSSNDGGVFRRSTEFQTKEYKKTW